MLPVKTSINWTSSSSFHLRIHFPTRVMRGSAPTVICPACGSCLHAHAAQLVDAKWHAALADAFLAEKTPVPGCQLMAMAIRASSGSSASNPSPEQTTSNSRLIMAQQLPYRCDDALYIGIGHAQ